MKRTINDLLLLSIIVVVLLISDSIGFAVIAGALTRYIQIRAAKKSEMKPE